MDPAGGKYVLYDWPHVPASGGVDLLAWSGGGTRALLEVAAGAGSAEQLDQLTLAAGTLTRLRLPASAVPVGYTRPDGLAVLAAGSPSRFPQDAWQLAGHVYVQLSGPACGTGSLAVIRGGRLADVPVRTGGRGATIAAASTSRLLIVAEGCMRSSGLLWFNPADSAQVQVLAPDQGMGVLGLVPYYQLNGG